MKIELYYLDEYKDWKRLLAIGEPFNFLLFEKIIYDRINLHKFKFNEHKIEIIK